jgi:hypothetical protein
MIRHIYVHANQIKVFSFIAIDGALFFGEIQKGETEFCVTDLRPGYEEFDHLNCFSDAGVRYSPLLGNRILLCILQSCFRIECEINKFMHWKPLLFSMLTNRT